MNRGKQISFENGRRTAVIVVGAGMFGFLGACLWFFWLCAPQML